MPIIRTLPVVAAAILACIHNLAQEAVRFGSWRAFCAPVAGCVLGVNSGEGDTLAVVEPPNGDDRLLLILADPPRAGGTIAMSLDFRAPVSFDATDGWRRADALYDGAVEILSGGKRDDLVRSMLRRDRLRITYGNPADATRQVVFSLNGYADTRGYVDGG